LAARALALSLTLAVLAALAAGCGGGSDAGSSTATAGQPQGNNGEKSIEGFGQESAGRGRAAILAAFHGYFEALADGRYEAACARLAAVVKRSLSQIAGRGSPTASCATTLPKLLAPGAARSARQQANGAVRKVRVQGGKAFVVYHAPGAKLYQMYLLREGGGWKATTLTGSTLVPSL
jgi:hypothetical protein